LALPSATGPPELLLLLHEATALTAVSVVANVNIAARLKRRVAAGMARSARLSGSALAQNGQLDSFVAT
jgi:hypothetical protein